MENVKNSGTQVNETSFYKMEMIKIQLFSAHGHPTVIDVENRMNAQAVCKDSLEFDLRVHLGSSSSTLLRSFIKLPLNIAWDFSFVSMNLAVISIFIY